MHFVSTTVAFYPSVTCGVFSNRIQTVFFQLTMSLPIICSFSISLVRMLFSYYFKREDIRMPFLCIFFIVLLSMAERLFTFHWCISLLSFLHLMRSVLDGRLRRGICNNSQLKLLHVRACNGWEKNGKCSKNTQHIHFIWTFSFPPCLQFSFFSPFSFSFFSFTRLEYINELLCLDTHFITLDNARV